MTWRAWGARTNATEFPTILLERSFTMHRTDTYGQERPAAYSAVEGELGAASTRKP